MRNKSILLIIVGIWILCVTIQRFAVPYVFKHVLHPYQVERIMNTFGVDYVPESKVAEVELSKQKDIVSKRQKKEKSDYNVKQSKIAIESYGAKVF